MDAEPLPPELAFPVPIPVLADPPPAVLDAPPELAPPDADPAALWAEPGSAAAMAPVARALAMPTPAVTADSRLRPRRLSNDGGTDQSAGLLGIGDSFPSWAEPACGCQTVAERRSPCCYRRCAIEWSGTYGSVLSYL
jgi:hypothetical protein